MSNVIKKCRFNAPISLPLNLSADSVPSDSPDTTERSLDFSHTVAVEIAQWRKRFEDHIDTRGTIHAQRVERAQRSGYEKGFEEGLLHERAERIAAIDILLREAKRKKEQAVHDLEARVIELAVGIAERIIGRRISVEPEIVADIIREAMSHIIGGETVILKVSEEDLDLVNAQYEKLLVLSGSAHEFRVEADRRLRRGDCLVETEGGLIDAVLASRLDYLTEELLKHT